MHILLSHTMLTVLCLQKTYNKQYENLDEEKQRFLTFVDNQKKIFRHNLLYSLGRVTYKLKSNQFADLTHKEFLKNYIGNSIVHDDERCLYLHFYFMERQLSIPITAIVYIRG